MLDPEYVCKYARSYKRMFDHVDQMKAMMKDGENEASFRTMEPEKKKKLEAILRDDGVCTSFKRAFSCMGTARNVSLTTGEAPDEEDLLDAQTTQHEELDNFLKALDAQQNA